MAALSREHRDGWGIAVFDDDPEGWRVDKGVACASEDARFHQLAVCSRGELLVAHIRQKTVGESTIANTHPFVRGRWLFAHNGTIQDVAWLRDQVSAERIREVVGETDSELLFAWLLTRLDDAGLTGAPASQATDHVLSAATRLARNHAGFGAFNFLLSDGTTTYAHRCGRTMHMLDLGPADEVRMRRRSSDGTVLETPWSPQRHAVFIASERMTDEPWQPVEEGTLLRVDREPAPQWRQIAA
jgi:glutamine amidotransferase